MQKLKPMDVTLQIIPSGGVSPSKWASLLFKQAYTYQSLLVANSTLLYLDLPSIVLLVDAIQPPIDVVRSYLGSWYKYITR